MDMLMMKGIDRDEWTLDIYIKKSTSALVICHQLWLHQNLGDHQRAVSIHISCGPCRPQYNDSTCIINKNKSKPKSCHLRKREECIRKPSGLDSIIASWQFRDLPESVLHNFSLHCCLSKLVVPGYILKVCVQGLKRWLTSLKHSLFSQRTCLWFWAHTW